MRATCRIAIGASTCRSGKSLAAAGAPRLRNRRRGAGSRRARQPGSTASTGASSRQSERGARRGAIGIQRHRVGERMADEARIDAMPRIDRRLHRKQAEHAVGARADRARAFLAPGPDRRADVMHRADARVLEPAFEAEVEVGRVDADEDIRAATRAGAGAASRRSAQQARQVRQHFGQAHHREFGGVVPGIQSGRAHARRRRRRRIPRRESARAAPSIRPAPSRSPEASPATSAIRIAVVHGHRSSGRSPLLDEIQHRAHVVAVAGQLGQLHARLGESAPDTYSAR